MVRPTYLRFCGGENFLFNLCIFTLSPHSETQSILRGCKHGPFLGDCVKVSQDHTASPRTTRCRLLCGDINNPNTSEGLTTTAL